MSSVNDLKSCAINYDNRVFTSKENTSNGEVNSRTNFLYHQSGHVIWAEYAGGDIVQGHLLGTTADNGTLCFRYHHLNVHGALRAGVCESTPHILPDGRLRMEETWKWLDGDHSVGHSVIEEE